MEFAALSSHQSSLALFVHSMDWHHHRCNSTMSCGRISGVDLHLLLKNSDLGRPSSVLWFCVVVLVIKLVLLRVTGYTTPIEAQTPNKRLLEFNAKH